ncbi:MAG: J domain-containing protein [Deltaproteobacteria bacterium]|nr:J domain-containing protein [Deltaproteobacteria bacterium]
MDLREAYERLDVEAGTPPKTARRAYLKLLKVHKPESDPDGFQRIREAWERIQEAKDWELEQLNRDPEPTNEPPADPFRPGLADKWRGVQWTMPRRNWGQQVILARGEKVGTLEHAKETARVVSQHSEWGGARSSAVPGDLTGNQGPDPLAGFIARCAKATDAERVAVAREAVAVMPERPEAYHLLHEALIVTSQMEAAAETLRTAHQAGLEGFLEPLLRQHPEHLRPEELDQARREAGHTLDPVAVARALLAREDPQGAVRAMRWGIDAALRGAKEHVPSVHVTLDFVLQLYRHHHPNAARELHDHLRRWMRDAGRETELRGSQLAATYHLTGELATLPRSFPAAVQAALSRGILDGDPSFASSELARWTLDSTLAEVAKAAEALSVYAPTLHRAVGRYLDRKTAGVYAPLPQPKLKHWADPAGAGKASAEADAKAHAAAGGAPGTTPKRGPSRPQLIGIGVLAVLVLIAIVRIVGSSSSSPRVIPQPPPIPAQVGPTAAQVHASADRICGHITPNDERCLAARAWADALAASNCPAVQAAKTRFETAMANPTGDPGDVALQNILINAAKFELERGTRIDCAAAAAGGFNP